MTLIAIDPGAISGAYAVFNGESVWVGDLDVVDGQLDASSLARRVTTCGATVAVVERVGAMPKQGVASTFKFGVAVGIIHGVLAGAGTPLHLVTPQVWKKYHGLRGSDGEEARALAIRLFPAVEGLHLKKHHNRADALLIGAWFLNREKTR
jgi:Holliday junction resolvasome RuvABC endonuclease subunit